MYGKDQAQSNNITKTHAVKKKDRKMRPKKKNKKDQKTIIKMNEQQNMNET